MADRIPWTPIVAGGGLILGIAFGMWLGPLGWGPPAEDTEPPPPPIPVDTDTDVPGPTDPPDPAPLARLPPPPPLTAALWDELAAALRPTLDGIPAVCAGGPAIPADPTFQERPGDLLPPLVAPDVARFVVGLAPTRIPVPRTAQHPDVVLEVEADGRCTVERVGTATVSGQVRHADDAPRIDRILVCESPVRVHDDGTFAGEIRLDAPVARSPERPCAVRIADGRIQPDRVDPGSQDLDLFVEAGDPAPALGPSWMEPPGPAPDVLDARLRAATRAVLDPELSPEARAWLRHRVAHLAEEAERPDPLADLTDLTGTPQVSIDEILDALDAAPDTDVD